MYYRTRIIEAMYVSLATHRTSNHATIKCLEKHNKIAIAIIHTNIYNYNQFAVTFYLNMCDHVNFYTQFLNLKHSNKTNMIKFISHIKVTGHTVSMINFVEIINTVKCFYAYMQINI